MYKVLSKIALVLAVIFSGCVLILSIIDAGSVDFETYQEINEPFYHNPLLIVGGLVLYCGALYLLGRLFYIGASTQRQKNFRMLLSFVLILLALTAVTIVWLRHYYYAPTVDQASVWYAGNEIAFNNANLSQPDYYIRYAYQQKMALFMAFIEKLGGNNYRTALYPLNLISLLLIVLYAGLLAYRASASQRAGTIASLSAASFLPLILYTSFVYPTLISMAAGMAAFYQVMRFLQTRKKRYILFEAFACFVMYASYSSTIICVMAILAVFILDLCILLSNKERKSPHLWKRLRLSAAMGIIPLIIAIVISFSAQLIFTDLTGIDATGHTIPKLAWVVMGISSHPHSRKPGGWDGSTVRYIEEAEYDEAVAEETIRNDFHQVLQEYADGTRSLKFFIVKTEYGWVSTWFGALKMVITPSDERGMNEMQPILESGILERADDILPSIQTFIYLFAFLMCLYYLTHPQQCARPESLLLIIYFVGGFLFQLFWENDPRYCLPYFTALIPVAAVCFNRIFFRDRTDDPADRRTL